MKLLYSAVAASMFATPVASQNLVSNGDFETGTFAGFTTFGPATDIGIDPVAASQGGFGAFFGPVGTIGGITQNLATVTGQRYLISFDLANRDGSVPNFFDVDFGSVQLFSATDSPTFEFRNFSVTALASGPSTTLSFAFRHDPDFFLLDNISVTAADVTAPIPEPAAWMMMLVGFGAAGIAMRHAGKARRVVLARA